MKTKTKTTAPASNVIDFTMTKLQRELNAASDAVQTAYLLDAPYEIKNARLRGVIKACKPLLRYYRRLTREEKKQRSA